jgi:hypothetical protein
VAAPQATPAPADDNGAVAVASATAWPLDRDAFWPVMAWALTSTLGVLVFASVLRRPDLVFALAGSPFLAAGARRRRERERPRPPVAAAAAVAVLEAPASEPDNPAVESPAAPEGSVDAVAADTVVPDAASGAHAGAPAVEPDVSGAETAAVEAPPVEPVVHETVAGPPDDALIADVTSVNDDAPLAAAAAARAAMIAGAKRPPLKFTSKAAKGVQRGKIGYRQVRVSAGPDDVRTAEVGRVDLKDEVEVIGEDESFFQVRTPEGVEGWVPRYVIRGFTTSTGK